MNTDIAITGAGPAGLALAVALAQRGASVTVFGGEDAPWEPNYGGWVDELEAAGLAAFAAKTWDDSEVCFDEDVQRLGRAYANVDKHRLRAALIERVTASGRLVWARANGVTHDDTGTTVHTDAGDTRCSLVVDAAGWRGAVLEPGDAPTLWQAAIGVGGQVDEHPWSQTCMTFMDFRQPPVVDDGAATDPTFIYAMPGPGRLFVEETSLIRGPAMPFGQLRRRLEARLQREGVSMAADTEERCLIPMDVGLPRLDQRVVGFGAAAGMVHPATGYSLLRSLHEAPALADTLVDALGRGLPPSRVACQAWRSLWTEERLVVRQLQLYGARILAGLTPQQVSMFFRAFFSMPDASQRAYQSGHAGLRDVTAAMWALFTRATPATQWQLVRSARQLPAGLLPAMLQTSRDTRSAAPLSLVPQLGAR
jgi:lycopene cyclase-like protein